MRVLHILDHSLPLQSGYSFRTHSILKNQRALGIRTEQLTLSKHGLHDHGDNVFCQDGITYRRSPALGARARRLPVLHQTEVIRLGKRAIEKAIVAFRPDILHAHSPSLNGLAAIKAAHQTALPVVYEMRASWEDAAVDHGSTSKGSIRYRLSRALETQVLRNVSGIVTICEGLRQNIRDRGIPSQRITVIPNAVDIAELKTHGGSAEFLGNWLLNDRPVIGFIGSFYGYEGLDTLIEAVALLKSRGSRAALLLVGGGPQQASLQRLVADLDLSDTVYFTGRVPHEDVSVYYRRLDAAVYPRKRIRLTETVTPLKPLEAMAASVPVLASNVGGHRELIENGKTGLLFPPDQPDSLADAIEKALSSAAETKAWTRNARLFIEKERTWAAVVAQYLPLYDKLLGRGDNAPVGLSYRTPQ